MAVLESDGRDTRSPDPPQLAIAITVTVPIMQHRTSLMSSASTGSAQAGEISARPVPYAAGGWTIAAHTASVCLIQATSMASMTVLPYIARKHFGAGDWQTTVITASPTILFVLSIFWNGLFARRRFAPYLLTYWLVACMPLAIMAQATSFWWLAAWHIVSSVGGAGYHPAAGDLLKHLYPERTRGRVYGIVWGSSLLTGALAGYGIGELLKHNPQSFSGFLPVFSVVQLAGVMGLIALSKATGHSAAREAVVRDAVSHPTASAHFFEPIAHMKTILKQDPTFARYEGAYMTYGVGWMICFALVPMLADDKLGLDYDQFMQATSVPYLLAMLAMIVPAGWLLDRLGAVRSVGLSFAMLSLHPLGLMIATGPANLSLVTAMYGIAHAGASMGWMLGPVSLAPSRDKVAQYVAIHATLVGVRGAIFQMLGVALYRWTGSFTWPLLLAAFAYLWSSWQMLALWRRMQKARAE